MIKDVNLEFYVLGPVKTLAGHIQVCTIGLSERAEKNPVELCVSLVSDKNCLQAYVYM